MIHLIRCSGLFVFLSIFILQSCTLSIPDKVETEYSNLTEDIDFNYHIKPILSDRCFQCHGPDSKTRKAGLRLDIEKIAFSKLASGNKAFSSSSIYGFLAIVLAAVNIFGGFLVTQRMLAMYKKKKKDK